MAIFCDNCWKEIVGGKYVYDPEHKREGKKFCSAICMHEVYAPRCLQCGQVAPRWVYDADRNDDKKFCSSVCMEQHYLSCRKKTQPKKSESEENKFDNKSEKDQESNSTRIQSTKNENEVNWTPVVIGLVVFLLVIGIIGATISWLFGKVTGKNK